MAGIPAKLLLAGLQKEVSRLGFRMLGFRGLRL